MKSAMERLTAAQHKAAEVLYRQAGAQPGGGQQPGGGPAEQGGSSRGGTGDVIDAEVVDEDKK